MYFGIELECGVEKENFRLFLRSNGLKKGAYHESGHLNLALFGKIKWWMQSDASLKVYDCENVEFVSEKLHVEEQSPENLDDVRKQIEESILEMTKLISPIKIDRSCGCHLHFSFEDGREIDARHAIGIRYEIVRLMKKSEEKDAIKQYKKFYHRGDYSEPLDNLYFSRRQEFANSRAKGYEWRAFNLSGCENDDGYIDHYKAARRIMFALQAIAKVVNQNKMKTFRFEKDEAYVGESPKIEEYREPKALLRNTHINGAIVNRRANTWFPGALDAIIDAASKENGKIAKRSNCYIFRYSAIYDKKSDVRPALLPCAEHYSTYKHRPEFDNTEGYLPNELIPYSNRWAEYGGRVFPYGYTLQRNRLLYVQIYHAKANPSNEVFLNKLEKFVSCKSEKERMLLIARSTEGFLDWFEDFFPQIAIPLMARYNHYADISEDSIGRNEEPDEYEYLQRLAVTIPHEYEGLCNSDWSIINSILRNSMNDEVYKSLYQDLLASEEEVWIRNGLRYKPLGIMRHIGHRFYFKGRPVYNTLTASEEEVDVIIKHTMKYWGKAPLSVVKQLMEPNEGERALEMAKDPKGYYTFGPVGDLMVFLEKLSRIYNLPMKSLTREHLPKMLFKYENLYCRQLRKILEEQD